MNNDMKKFLRKLLLIPLFISCFFVFGAFIIGNQYQESYNASIIDKVDRLKSINEPKIILVGNSSLAFGINSKMLQDAINMPVVNLGINGGLGNFFHEEIAKININSDDLVIVCHSDFADNDTIKDALLIWVTIEYNWNLYSILRDKDYIDMLRIYPIYWFKSLWLWLSNSGNILDKAVNNRRSFNKFGDFADKTEQKRLTLQKLEEQFDKYLNVPEISDECMNRLNEYNKYIKSKGATLLIAGYPIADSNKFTPPKEDFDKFQRELASRLDCEVISDYRDYFIPYKYFYDNHLHLDNEGTIIRTNQLIKDIKRWQSKRQNKTGNL